jgi:anti-anti-sigma factor
MPLAGRAGSPDVRGQTCVGEPVSKSSESMVCRSRSAPRHAVCQPALESCSTHTDDGSTTGSGGNASPERAQIFFQTPRIPVAAIDWQWSNSREEDYGKHQVAAQPSIRGSEHSPQHPRWMECSALTEIEPFRCEIRAQQEEVAILPVGELDMATAPVVEAHLSEQQTAGFKHLTLDLRNVCFLDSSGLRMILVWVAMSRADGFAFSLVAGPPTVQGIFELTGTAQRLNFVDASSAARVDPGRLRDQQADG